MAGGRYYTKGGGIDDCRFGIADLRSADHEIADQGIADQEIADCGIADRD
jgi:hypothetical protein